MGKHEKEAMKKLRTIMPDLYKLQSELKNTQDSLKDLKYYKKFRIGIDAPSIIPLHEIEKFAVYIVESKNKLFHFKQKFNENNLPQDIRQIFISIIVQLGSVESTTSEVVIKDGNVIIRRNSTWRKSTLWVKERWDKPQFPYKVKADYSIAAYGFMTRFSVLIEYIDSLKSMLA